MTIDLVGMRQVGTWDPLLQCLHLDKHLLSYKIQRNYKGLKIYACLCSWGKSSMKRYKKTKKPNCHF